MLLLFLIIKIGRDYFVSEDYFAGYNIKQNTYLDRKVYELSAEIKNENAFDKTILYIHGGSYTAVMSKSHWDFLKNIVDDLGCRVIVPEYPLIPEGNYKDVFEFIIPIYNDIIKEVGEDNLILIGDSAGGAIAIALCQKNGENAVPQPLKTILISPWLDVSMTNPEIDNVAKYDKDLNKVALKIAGEIYAGKDGMDDFAVNPIIGPLDKLKNVIIFTGTHDILNPDVHVLYERSTRMDADIKIIEKVGAGHIWFIKKKTEYNKKELEDYNEFIKVIRK